VSTLVAKEYYVKKRFVTVHTYKLFEYLDKYFDGITAEFGEFILNLMQEIKSAHFCLDAEIYFIVPHFYVVSLVFTPES